MTDLYQALLAHCNVQPDRRGEGHIQCPYCGKEPKPGATHASFNKQGFKCFICQAGVSLSKLADKLHMAHDGQDDLRDRVQPRETRIQTPYWQQNAIHYLQKFVSHPQCMQLWHGYKTLPPHIITAYRLGVGVLPASKCEHERLIVPVLERERVVWFRGRSLGCSCGKWLASGGVTVATMPLYNQDALRTGQVVWIVENPIDALLVGIHTPYVGVATLSVCYWYESWQERLQQAQPEMVVVCYDNDIPGNGGGVRHHEFAQEWERQHQAKAPLPNGIKLVNRLLKAGIPARLYPWPKSATVKADVGNLFAAPARNHSQMGARV